MERHALVAASALAVIGAACGSAAGTHSGAGAAASASSARSSSDATGSNTSGTGAGGAPGTTSGSVSTSSSGGSASPGGDAGGPSQSGDCATDADCPSGSCVAVTPGGFRVCAMPPPVAATMCTSSQDLCCPGSCDAGVPCDVGPLQPTCISPLATQNQCAVDQCAMDSDCAAGHICVPVGVFGFGIRACVAASCKLDSDCGAFPGGICAPVQNPCCTETASLSCVYQGHGGCRKKSDCPSGQYCDDAETGVAVCTKGSPVCAG